MVWLRITVTPQNWPAARRERLRFFRYLAAHTVQEDDFLSEPKSESLKEGLPPIWIAPE